MVFRIFSNKAVGGVFMLSALDEKGQLVSVLDGIPDKQAFRCPACYAALHLKNGMVLRPHFAHEIGRASCRERV